MATYDYTLRYSSNGGGSAPTSQTATSTASHYTFTIPDASLTRTGYMFLGWSRSGSASSAAYLPGGSISVDPGTTTLYAVWQARNYTVSYNKGSAGTGSNTTDTKAYNVPLTLKGAIFTRLGYAQTGWATSDGGTQAYALGGKFTGNYGITLYPVWTAGRSSVFASDGTLGTEQTISVIGFDSSYKHTLTYEYGSASGTIVTKDSRTDIPWRPSLNLASEFPSATSGTCTITCETFDGDTSVGVSSTTITLSIPESVKQAIASISIADTVSGVYSHFGEYVQNKSKVQVTVNPYPDGAYGATIVSYYIEANGQTFTENNPITSLLSQSGTNTVTARIVDSRGRVDEKSTTFVVRPYTAPSVTQSSERNDIVLTSIDVSYTWNITDITSAVNPNSKTIDIKYRVYGSYAPPTTATTITPSSYSGSGTYTITGLSDTSPYEIFVVATDYFGSATITENVAGIGGRIFHISKTDTTVARHGRSPSDGWDHQYFNEKFHGFIDVAALRFSSTISTGGWYRVTSCSQSGSAIRLSVGVGSEQIIDAEVLISSSSVAQIIVKNSQASNAISGIRVMLGGGSFHIDIQKATSANVTVSVDLTPYGNARIPGNLTAASLTSVYNDPSGETRLAIISITKKTTPLSSPTSLLTNGTIANSTTFSYTATQPCWFYYVPVLQAGTSGGFEVKLNNVILASYTSGEAIGVNVAAIPVPMQKGDVLDISQASNRTSSYRVLTMRGAS